MQVRATIAKASTGLERLLDALAVTLMLATAGVAVLQVFCRYVLNASLPWPEELAQYTFSWAVFLGMPLLTARGSHISITLFARRLGPVATIWHQYLLRVVIATVSTVIIVHGIDFMGRAMQVSPALGIHLKWIFLAVPVGGVLNLLFLARPGQGPVWAGLACVALGAAAYLGLRYGAQAIYGEDSASAVLMVVAIGLILLEVPIAFAMIFGVFAAFAPLDDMFLVIITQYMSASLNNFTLLAIPFFILAAAVMNAGGITTRIVDLATHLVGHFRGGLGQANIVTNLMLAGVSGSSTADASAIAKLLVPEMEKRGYDRAFSCALTAASSTLANLIPPGLGLIIYAALASVSVGALFVGTIVPGLMAAMALMLVVYVVSRRRGYGGDRPRSSGAERARAGLAALPALFLPVFIVGGVRFGVFTATEAGAMALVVAILTGTFAYRSLTARNFVEAAREAASDTIAVAIIIAAASPFAYIMAFEQTPQRIAAWLASLSESRVVLLLLINLFLLFVGLFMEMIAALVILVPILVPVVAAAGVSPLQFGIVIVMNLVIGALTPPLGVLVFTTARVGGADSIRVFRAILPFIAALLIVLLLVTFIPALVLVPISLLGP